MAAPTEHLLGIDPKMYRHFAAMTVAISLCVAILADGEATEAITSEVQKRNEHAELKRADEVRSGKTRLVDNRSNKGGGWGSDGGRYGAPMDGSAIGDGIDSGPAMPISAAPGYTVEVEIDKRALASMTPSQRAAYLKQMRDEKNKRETQGPYMPNSNEISALRAASAARSGSANGD